MEMRINHRQDDANKRLENGIINLKKKVDTVSNFTYQSIGALFLNLYPQKLSFKI